MIKRLLLLLFITILFPVFSEAQNRYLFGVSVDNNLIRINLAGTIETVIGPITVPDVKGLAHDPLTGTTYCITSSGTLCSINLSTGEATTIQTLSGGPFDIYGIALDRVAVPPKIYIINNISPRQFYHLDISGSPPFTPVLAGNSGGTAIFGMAVNTGSTSLYAVDSTNNFLILNKATGLVDTPIGPTGQTNLRGLAYDNLTDAFFGTTSTGQLLSINGSGSATIIGTTQIVSHITFVVNIPPTPTPTATPTETPVATSTSTATPTATPTPGIVVPGIQPSAPEITVDLTKVKPIAMILLQAFTGASRNKETAFLGAKAPKVGFQYSVEIKRTTDASGEPLKKSQRDIKKLTTKKNELTVKNLKPNSGYDVRYKVEITSKVSGSPPKILGKTLFSPTERFTID